MDRLAAVILTALFGSSVLAQPPAIGGTPLVVTPTVPGKGFYKSGGVHVGANGSLPYDTGHYLLGGTDGLARSAGTFTLVVPPGVDSEASSSLSAVAGPCCSKGIVTGTKRFRW